MCGQPWYPVNRWPRFWARLPIHEDYVAPNVPLWEPSPTWHTASTKYYSLEAWLCKQNKHSCNPVEFIPQVTWATRTSAACTQTTTWYSTTVWFQQLPRRYYTETGRANPRGQRWLVIDFANESQTRPHLGWDRSTRWNACHFVKMTRSAIQRGLATLSEFLAVIANKRWSTGAPATVGTVFLLPAWLALWRSWNAPTQVSPVKDLPDPIPLAAQSYFHARKILGKAPLESTEAYP